MKRTISISPSGSHLVENVEAHVRRLDGGVSVFVPENYEPTYAYPLLVWTVSMFDDEADFDKRMSAISSRNVIGLRVVAGVDPVSAVATAVAQVRAEFNIHTERIVPIGVGSSASTSLGLFLQSPSWFAGAICVNPVWGKRTQMPIPFRNPALRERHVLFAGMANGARRIARVLNAAGVNVSHGSESDSCWRQVDHWVLETMCDCVIT